jgi:outer membrane lipoprotein-sorting protein
MGSRSHAGSLTRAGSRGHAGSLTRLVAILAAAGLMLSLAGCGRKAKEPERRRSTPTSPAEEALVDLADRYADLDSFSERTRITKTVSDAEGQETTVSQTELSFRRPNRIFYQMTGDDTTVIACNGKRLIVYSSAQGGYVEDDPPENLTAFLRDHRPDAMGLDEFLLLAGSDPLEALDDVAVAEGDPIDDQPVQVLQGTVKRIAQDESAEGVAATQSLYVGEEDGLVHKIVTEIERGEASLRTEEVFEQPAADPTIPDDRFDYQPPADAENLTPE